MKTLLRVYGIVTVIIVLTGCATPAPPLIDLDEPVRAELLPPPPLPVEVVTVAEPLPLPGQLKPLPGTVDESPEHEEGNAGDDEGNEESSMENRDGEQVARANAAARVGPEADGFINAIQVWPYSEGALYQVYASPERVTAILLQPGEELITVAAGDTVRWIVGDTLSGSGPEQRVTVLVKPVRTDIRTNMVITTHRRTYLVELSSTAETWMASVSWHYPHDRMLVLQRQNQTAQAATPVETGIALERVRFRYAISGDDSPWRPLRVFDDMEKVFIQFPAGIAQGELPPLFVIGPEGDGQLVNYRFRSPYYIVDRLFGAAELRLGGDRGQVVRIERTDSITGRH